MGWVTKWVTCGGICDGEGCTKLACRGDIKETEIQMKPGAWWEIFCGDCRLVWKVMTLGNEANPTWMGQLGDLLGETFDHGQFGHLLNLVMRSMCAFLIDVHGRELITHNIDGRGENQW